MAKERSLSGAERFKRRRDRAISQTLIVQFQPSHVALSPSLFLLLAFPFAASVKCATSPHNLPWNGTPLSSLEWHGPLANHSAQDRQGTLSGNVWTNQKPGEMSKLRCGPIRRILPRVLPGIGALAEQLHTRQCGGREGVGDTVL